MKRELFDYNNRTTDWRLATEDLPEFAAWLRHYGESEGTSTTFKPGYLFKASVGTVHGSTAKDVVVAFFAPREALKPGASELLGGAFCIFTARFRDERLYSADVEVSGKGIQNWKPLFEALRAGLMLFRLECEGAVPALGAGSKTRKRLISERNKSVHHRVGQKEAQVLRDWLWETSLARSGVSESFKTGYRFMTGGGARGCGRDVVIEFYPPITVDSDARQHAPYCSFHAQLPYGTVSVEIDGSGTEVWKAFFGELKNGLLIYKLRHA